MPKSGFGIEIKTNSKQVLREFKRIEAKHIPAAMVSALNKAAKDAQRDIQKTVAQRIGVKRGVYAKRVRFYKSDKARKAYMIATVRIGKREINAASLLTTARQESLIQRTHGPVKKRPKSITAYGRHRYRNVFVGRGKNENVLIMSRKPGSARTVGDVKRIPHIHESEKMAREIGRGRNTWAKRLRHELDRRIKRGAR